MWGSDIYLGFYDEPELIKDLMKLINKTYISYLKEVKKYINDEKDGFLYHWETLFKGNIVLRNDSTVNLSKDMYKEFVKPYDEEILDAFDGGSIHFCGRADQWIFEMIKSNGLMGMNFGKTPNGIFGNEYLKFIKPEFNKNKMPIIHYTMTKEEYAKFDKDKFGKGISICCTVNSKVEAKEILNKR